MSPPRRQPAAVSNGANQTRSTNLRLQDNGRHLDLIKNRLQYRTDRGGHHPRRLQIYTTASTGCSTSSTCATVQRNSAASCRKILQLHISPRKASSRAHPSRAVGGVFFTTSANFSDNRLLHSATTSFFILRNFSRLQRQSSSSRQDSSLNFLRPAWNRGPIYNRGIIGPSTHQTHGVVTTHS